MTTTNTPKNRKGFIVKKPVIEQIENPKAFTVQSNICIYASMKLTQSGVSCWKTFEGFPRKMHKNSLSNHLNPFFLYIIY